MYLTPICFYHSVLPDGESVSVNVPKDEGAGLINNQQETFNFKVCKLASAICAHHLHQQRFSTWVRNLNA